MNGPVPDPVTLAQRLISLDTSNPPGNETPVIELLAGILDSAFAVDLVGPETRRSLVAHRWGSSARRPVVLCGHLDVVPVGTAAWTIDPFAATLDGDRLWGRGASDMKAGVAAMTVAALRWAERHGAGDLYLAFTADEERGGLGAEALSSAGKLPADGALVIGEPTGLDIGVAAKGCLWLRLVVRGRASHAAYPSVGLNALELALSLTNTLLDTLRARPPEELLGAQTAVPTIANSGTAPNMVPATAECWIDCRTLPGVDHAALLAGLRDLVAAALPTAAQVELTVENDRPGVAIDPHAPAVSTIRRVVERQTGKPPRLIGTAFFSDASIFVRHGHYDVVLLGPGQPELAHVTDEWVSAEAVRQASDIYEALIDEVGA